MITEFLQSEEICVDFCSKSSRWVFDLYNSNSQAFHRSASIAEPLPKAIAPNAATSHIGVVVSDLLHSKLLPRSDDEHRLHKCTSDARSALAKIKPSELLPLKTFGLLPLFSTGFLHEFLALDDSCLGKVSFSITSRRLLYLIFLHLVRDSSNEDLLHPYLVFRLARSVVALKNLFSTREKELPGFLRTLRNKNLQISAVPHEGLGEILGFNKNSKEFHRRLISPLRKETLEILLQQIERYALNSASTELAWHSTPRKDRADPTALLFSVATLSSLNADRHDLMISQSIKVLLAEFNAGVLPAGRPFQIDDRGQALFVATLECASTLLDLLLSRIERFTNAELAELLRVTDELQSYMIEDANEFRCTTPAGGLKRHGWCSDRAFSETRIDSWVTVEAYAFFRKRLALIGLTKKELILSQYSWLPSSRCKPDWDEIVDPNLGQIPTTLVLDRIRTIVSDASGHARLFLLYGPPGTAKTTIAYGLARELEWELITLSPSDFVKDSLDKIEQRSRELFTHMMNVERCVILFDEMDTLLRDREVLATTSPGMMIEFVVPALLPKLQQFRDHTIDREVVAFFVTNFYERLDASVLRRGRLDNHLLILPYTRAAQMEVGHRILAKHREGRALRSVYAELTEVLSEFPCNLTYRDLDWLSCALLKGRDGRKAIEEHREEIGVSPTIYSPTKRPNAFRELVSFMERYEGRPVGLSTTYMTTEEMKVCFTRYAKKYPPYACFFTDWVKALAGRYP